jgi:hypothetical protein
MIHQKLADHNRIGSSYVELYAIITTIDAQNYWVGVSTPVFQDLIGWRLYPMHAFFCSLSFVTVYFCELPFAAVSSYTDLVVYPETKGGKSKH